MSFISRFMLYVAYLRPEVKAMATKADREWYWSQSEERRWALSGMTAGEQKRRRYV